MSEKHQNSQNSTGGGNTEGGSTDRYIRVRTDTKYLCEIHLRCRYLRKLCRTVGQGQVLHGDARLAA
jgi:hypothetical protein